MFSVSTKSRYGLRALIELARNREKNPVSLGNLADKQDISNKYLESIFGMLQKKRIIRSRRGAKGGYVLGRAPEDISLLEILEAIEGPIRLLDCLHDKRLCSNIARCPTRCMWDDLEKYIVKFLEKRTLKKMVDDASVKRKKTGRKK